MELSLSLNENDLSYQIFINYALREIPKDCYQIERMS